MTPRNSSLRRHFFGSDHTHADEVDSELAQRLHYIGHAEVIERAKRVAVHQSISVACQRWQRWHVGARFAHPAHPLGDEKLVRSNRGLPLCLVQPVVPRLLSLARELLIIT